MPPKRTGTGFINLQTYLDLNRGAADAMGGAAAGDVEKAGQGVTSDLEKFQQDFKPGATAGTSSLSGLEGWNDLTGRALDAQGKANAAGTMGGTATLLREKYGGNTWGGGMLDAALARAGGAGGRLANAHGAYGRLVEKLGAANDASAKQAAPTPAAPPAPKVEYEKPPPGADYKGDQLYEYGWERPPKPPKPPRVVRGAPVTSAY